MTASRSDVGTNQRAAQWLRPRAARRSARVHHQNTASLQSQAMRLQRSRQPPPYNAAEPGIHLDRGPYDTGMPSTYFHRCSRSFLEQGRTARLRFPARQHCSSPQFTRCGPGTSAIPPREPCSGPFARLFVGYAFAEGWAHYAEEMMWEYGPRRPEPRAAYRPDRGPLMRDARCFQRSVCTRAE